MQTDTQSNGHDDTRYRTESRPGLRPRIARGDIARQRSIDRRMFRQLSPGCNRTGSNWVLLPRAVPGEAGRLSPMPAPENAGLGTGSGNASDLAGSCGEDSDRPSMPENRPALMMKFDDADVQYRFYIATGQRYCPSRPAELPPSLGGILSCPAGLPAGGAFFVPGFSRRHHGGGEAIGAGGGTRTRTPWEGDFKSPASTGFATPARAPQRRWAGARSSPRGKPQTLRRSRISLPGLK